MIEDIIKILETDFGWNKKNENGFSETQKMIIADTIKAIQVQARVSPKTADIENDCWHCKEFEQHINQRTGYCHKNKFSANVRIAKKIKCGNFEHYQNQLERFDEQVEAQTEVR